MSGARADAALTSCFAFVAIAIAPAMVIVVFMGVCEPVPVPVAVAMRGAIVALHDFTPFENGSFERGRSGSGEREFGALFETQDNCHCEGNDARRRVREPEAGVGGGARRN